MNYAFGLGKQRTALGRFIDREGISQGDLVSLSGVNKNTITLVCGDLDYKPSSLTKRRIVYSLNKSGYECDVSDFW